MEHLWTDNGRGKPKYAKKNLSEYRFVHHKSQAYWPGIEPASIAAKDLRLDAWGEHGNDSSVP
jgi:hypothetical protein